MAFKFEQLRVWEAALDLATKVSTVVKAFPTEERFVLAQQFQRATDSVCLNIAEGSTGQSDKEFARFLGIAIRSGIECVGCIHLARKRNLVNQEIFQDCYNDLESLIKMIQALRNTLRE